MSVVSEPITRVPEPLPQDLGASRLGRRAAELGLLGLIVALLISTLPGLSEVRDRFADAQLVWLLAVVALELASCLSYVVAFRGVFCARLELALQLRDRDGRAGDERAASGRRRRRARARRLGAAPGRHEHRATSRGAASRSSS